MKGFVDMNNDCRFLIIGGDDRYVELEKMLVSSKNVLLFSNDASDKEIFSEIEKSSVIILPIPLTRDGEFLFLKNCPERQIRICDVLKKCAKKPVFAGAVPKNILNVFNNIHDFCLSKSFALENAVLTAEAAVSTVINSNQKSIYHSKILIIGFGKIGSVLTKYLVCMGAEVFVLARNDNALNLAQKMGAVPIKIGSKSVDLSRFDYVINTAPAFVLSEDELKTKSDDMLYFELASAPFGIDENIAKKLNFNIYKAPRLPGRYSSKSAAKIILNEIMSGLDN